MKEYRSSQNLIEALKAVLLKQRLVMFAAGLVTTLTVMTALMIILSLLANVIVLPVAFKISLLLLGGGIAAYIFYRHALRRLFSGDVDRVAVGLEAKHPDLKGRLIAAVQFARLKNDMGYSGELIAATERQALKQTGLINVNEVISFFPILTRLRYLLGSAALAVLLLLVIPGLFSYSYEVYSNPTTEIAPPLAYQVSPVPGSTQWVKYRDIQIGAAIFGQRLPEKATVHHRLADGHWQKTDIDLTTLTPLIGQTGDSLECLITLRQINKSFDYYVEAGRLKTEVQQVDVVDRPRVAAINLEIFYPEYTGLPPLKIEENNGSFSAVIGSRANLSIEANLPVASAALVFEDSSRAPLKVTDRKGETSLLVDKSRSYFIELVDNLGETNPDPIEYYITAVADEYPSIDVLFPGFNVNLTESMTLPLKVHIYDDYGFSSLVLKYQIASQGVVSDESVAVIHFPERIKTEGDIEFQWDLNQFHLFPGDYVAYYFEVADNDMISGPKVTKSRQYIARLPSLDEIVASTEQEGQQRIRSAENLIKTGKELKQRLEQAMRRMESENRQKDAADWQQQKELESIAEKNVEMLRKMEEMAEQMDSSLERMQEHSLMSREIMEKLQEIQKLFQEVATPEMKEAQRQLMEALKNMDRQQLQKALEDFKMTQEELMERLERTVALLKLIQVEQKMEAMIRKVEELVERQESINQQAESSRKEDLPQLSPPEDEIRKSLENLKEEVNQLRDLLEEAGLQKSQEAQEFAKAVENSDADEHMKQMSQAMQQQKPQESQQQGGKALSKLLSMLDEMQKQQMAMKGGDMEETKRAMRRSIEDANYLSRNQEELLDAAGNLSPASMVNHELALDQQDLLGACQGLRNGIAELGKQSPFVATELTAMLDNVMANMETAVGLLGERRGAAGVAQQREAMAELNRVSLRLMESLEKQNDCQNASNCDKNMSMMESMCNKQNQLNQDTRRQCNNPQQGPDGQKQMRQGLERLAGEQGAIRKTIEQLEREFGQSRQILGRLDDIAREMKKVEEDLMSGEVGQETQERQLRIYSRMLEASRSLQRKDFSEQRQARTADGDLFYVPPELTNGLTGDQNQIEDRLQKYLGDSYPAQYEEQIKAYFRALLQLQYQLRQQP